MSASESKQHQFAFRHTPTHKGLKNSTGENNCFLNVTIQALWHLGPFRANMKQLMVALMEGQFSSQFVDRSFILALCNLFIQYEFAEEQVLPPDELRSLLGALNAKFGVGKIADANEALDTILQRIHSEFAFLCPSKCKCLSHQTFGVQVIEQYICGLCGATSEPCVTDNFLIYFQSMEFLLQAARLNQVRLLDSSPMKVDPLGASATVEKRKFSPMGQMLNFATTQFQKKIHPPTKSENYPLHEVVQQSQLVQRLKNRLFGMLLRQCMVSLGQHSCPSLDDPASQGRFRCGGKALPRFNCLDAPLSLALSFGWTNIRESNENIHSFLSLVPSNVFLQDIYPAGESTEADQRLPPAYRSQGNESALLAYLTSRDKTSPLDYVELEKYLAIKPAGPSYALRGMVCYYGLHYVSIFLDNQEDNVFLLFDDQRVRPIGNWADVIDLCVKSLYQPVLLIYELEVRELSQQQQSSTLEASYVVNYNHILKDMKPSKEKEKEGEFILSDDDSFVNITAEDVKRGDTENVQFTSSPAAINFSASSSTWQIGAPSKDAPSTSLHALSNSYLDGIKASNEEDKHLRSASSGKKSNLFSVIDMIADGKLASPGGSNDVDVVHNDEAVVVSEVESIADIRRRYNLPSAIVPFSSSNQPQSGKLFADNKAATDCRNGTFSHSLSSSVLTPIIRSWGKKPLRYVCIVPVYNIQGKVFLGMQFSINTEAKLPVVINFSPHPTTQRPTWVERQGRVQLMDQLVSLNGCLLRGTTLEEFSNMFRHEVIVTSPGSFETSTSRSNGCCDEGIDEDPDIVGKVRLEFQSEYVSVTTFLCPECLERVVIDNSQEQALVKQFNKENSTIKNQTFDTSLFVTLICPFCKFAVRAIDFPYANKV